MSDIQAGDLELHIPRCDDPAPEVRHRAALTVADNVRRTGNDDLGTLLAMLDLGGAR